MVVISFFILSISTSVEIAKSDDETFTSIYHWEDSGSPTFMFDQHSSFYEFYTFKDDPAFVMRKIGHFVVYGMIACTIFIVLPLEQLWVRCLLAWISASIIGLVDETHQHFLIGRDGRVLDVLLNMSGALCFVMLMVVASVVLNVGRELPVKKVGD